MFSGQVEVVLYKRDRSGDEDEWWPRLCYSRDRLPWLKVDFDRFAVSDSEPDDDPANDVSTYNHLSVNQTETKYPTVKSEALVEV